VGTVGHRAVVDAVAGDVGRFTAARAREIARRLGAGAFVQGKVVGAGVGDAVGFVRIVATRSSA
jgi:hypothetical protein